LQVNLDYYRRERAMGIFITLNFSKNLSLAVSFKIKPPAGHLNKALVRKVREPSRKLAKQGPPRYRGLFSFPWVKDRLNKSLLFFGVRIHTIVSINKFLENILDAMSAILSGRDKV